jgi:hypothetical protein
MARHVTAVALLALLRCGRAAKVSSAHWAPAEQTASSPARPAVAGPEALLWQSPAAFNTDEFDTGVLVTTLQGLVNRNASTFGSPTSTADGE